MKPITLLFLLLGSLAFSNMFAWGPTGHRTVGEVAERYLSAKTKRVLKELLRGESLASAATFADDIKSDKRYKSFSPWHYVNMSLDKKYGEEPLSEEGDVVVGIEKCMAILGDEKATREDKVFYLKLLIHFIGDVHQPLHVGRADDKGGNDIQVQWFGKGTNLHRVWDSEMIESYGMSYTELAINLPVLSKKEVKMLQQGSYIDWIHESQGKAKKVYASASTGEKLGYEYMYEHFEMVKSQLLAGGVRLAKLLNDVL